MPSPSHSLTTAALPPPPARPRFPIWRFLLALAALPFLLVSMAAASWLAWMCFQGVMGPPGAVIALAAIAALAAIIRRHTGMALGAALSLVALLGLAGLVWVVFALLAVALVARVRWHAPLRVLPHVSRSKRLIGHSIARTIVPATSAASHRPCRPSLERIKTTFSRTTTASVARAISR